MRALHAQDTAAATAWLDRAHRLAPDDPTVRLGLATAWLRANPAHAAQLFATLTTTELARTAWHGIAAARTRLGDVTGAAIADAHANNTPDAVPDDTPDPPPARPTKPPPRRAPARRPIDIVIPVYRDTERTLACLDSVLAARPRGGRVIVVDDASPESALASALDRLAARRRILLIRHRRNRGFPAAANAGLARARAAGHDAVLLNADTLVAPHFATRLAQAAHAAPDIATACPLSNNATILSYPDPAGGNPMPNQAGTRHLADRAWATHGALAVAIPTGVGFCLYLRNDALRAVGPLRADVFGRGYGEENDWCMRASAAGWRHVAAPGVFVAHAGEASFGPDAAALRARNIAILRRLHPRYARQIAAHAARDPLFHARRALESAGWPLCDAPAVLLVSHAQGGGVARTIELRRAILQARAMTPVVLTPVEGHDGAVRIAGSANLRFVLPEEHEALLALLHAARVTKVEFHHSMGLPPGLLRLPAELGVPYDVHVHDYHWFCPRLVLSGAKGRYCGEPEAAQCERCIRQRGSLLGEEIGVAALRARSAGLLARATRVLAPSADAATRLNRHFPAIRPRVLAPPPPPDPVRPDPAIAGLPRHPGRRRIAVVGAIGKEKGYDVLLDLARDAKEADRALEFVVIGHTIADDPLLRTGRVFITGPYRAAEAVALIRAQACDLALLPSIVPETWCHTLSECWRANLDVIAFDLGAQAERIRATGRGALLPPGLSAAAINRALLAARL